MSDRPECILVLASASPRRRRLVAWLGLPVEFTAVDTPEDLDSPLSSQPELLASHLAAEKARAARAEYGREHDTVASFGGEARSGTALDATSIVLAFDTIVVLDGRILGKPTTVDDAWRMLRDLSGREHEVVTGVAIAAPGAEEPLELSVTTRVRMKPLTDADIEAWMAEGEFMGCAGAYNIEGQIAEVDADECFQNVAGLPLCHVREALASLVLPCDASGLASPVEPCDRALARACGLGPHLT